MIKKFMYALKGLKYGKNKKKKVGIGEGVVT